MYWINWPTLIDWPWVHCWTISCQFKTQAWERCVQVEVIIQLQQSGIQHKFTTLNFGKNYMWSTDDFQLCKTVIVWTFPFSTHDATPLLQPWWATVQVTEKLHQPNPSICITLECIKHSTHTHTHIASALLCNYYWRIFQTIPLRASSRAAALHPAYEVRLEQRARFDTL